MGVMVTVIAFLIRGVDRNINRNPVALNYRVGKFTNSLMALFFCQACRKRNDELAGNSRVFPRFCLFSGIPKLITLRGPNGGILRQKDFGVLNTTTTSVVMDKPRPFVDHSFTCTISNRRRSRTASGTADWF
ncbi:hypothetical protein BM547_31010 [Pseudomonas aeruginosa]|nr:hypothetical protein BM547_31010 [Pseudomonas aeruginosa]